LISGPPSVDDAGMEHEDLEHLHARPPMRATRRSFLRAVGASCVAGIALPWAEPPREAAGERTFHVCLSPEAILSLKREVLR